MGKVWCESERGRWLSMGGGERMRECRMQKGNDKTERGPRSWPAVSWLMMMRMAMRKNSHLSWRESGQVKKGYVAKRGSGRGKSGKNLRIHLIISDIKNDGILPSHQSTVLNGRRQNKPDKINNLSKMGVGHKEGQWETELFFHTFVG